MSRAHATRVAATAPHKPSRLQLALLALLAPASFREELVGDWIEELATSRRLAVLTRREARTWLWRQIAASAPHLVRSRFTTGGATAKTRWISSALFCVVGCLQAWDSRVLAAPWWVIALVAGGIAVHAIGLLLASTAHGSFIALLGMGVLLAVAKVASPAELPALGVIGPIGFACLLMRTYFERKATSGSPPDASNPA